MVAPLTAYDAIITLGSSTLSGMFARDQQGNPMSRRSYSPPLMPVSITAQDVTYSSIPREQGSDIAIEGVAGGAGAYYYTPGKYGFGDAIQTESGLVYPGPATARDTAVNDTTATTGTTVSTSSNANPTVITTAAAHGLATGESVIISGHSVAAVNATHVVTVTGATTFTVPVASTGGTGGTWTLVLPGVIAARCRHYDSTQSAEVDYIVAHEYLYKWDITNLRWKRTHTAAAQPGTQAISNSAESNPVAFTTLGNHPFVTGDSITIAGHTPADGRNGTFTVTVTGATSFTVPFNSLGLGVGGATGTVRLSAATPGTDILSFNNGTNRLLLWAAGSLHRYRVSTNDGATWANGTDASATLKVNYWGVKERGLAAATVMAAVSPDVIYVNTEPAAGAWDTGTRVGTRDLTDNFTSLATAPITGEVLAGKKLGWRTFDSAGATIMAYGPVPASSGVGADNFTHPSIVGGRIYALLNDFDIIEYDQGTITTGFGVANAGPRITEMQQAITALAGDGHRYLYAALKDTNGYVMRGSYQADSAWHWHGSIIKLGLAIGRMWVSSHSAAADKNQYLTMCPTASPYLPYRALIPRTDLQTDSDARFSTAGNIRFGYERAGQAHVFKKIAHQIMQSINVDTNNTWNIAYRKDDTLTWTSPSIVFNVNSETEYYPANVYGKRIEFRATYASSANTNKPAIETLITRMYRRPIRLKSGQFSLMATTLNHTLAGAQDIAIGPQAMEVFLRETLMDDIDIPLLTLTYNNSEVAVPIEILNIEESWARVASPASEGPGHALVFTVTWQELPITGYTRTQTYQGGAP